MLTMPVTMAKQRTMLRYWPCLLCALVLALLQQAQGQAAASKIDPASYLKSQIKRPDYHVNDKLKAHKRLPAYQEIRTAATDTFEYLPQQFLPEYQNPCWNDKAGAFKCLPYFQILGVSKCGTTDLYNRLTFHPDMVDCSWKGPHFWDEAVYPTRRQKPGRYDGSFRAYVGIFDKAAAKIQKNTRAITGEASSNTFTAVYSHLRGRTLTKKINSTLAEYLYEATPWARYIVLFRDPLKRYHSAFHYYRSKKDGPGTAREFLDRVKSDIQEWNDCLKQSTLLICLKEYRPQQLVKGLYIEFIPAWLKVWPRDRLLFMRSEDYLEAPKEHIHAAMSFLGLSDPTPKQWSEIVDAQARNTQASKYKNVNGTGEIATAYKLLQDFYRPYNKRLSAFFGNDPRWLWEY